MRLRVVDYILSDGGGARFTVQLLKALQATGEISEVTLVSHGDTLLRYRRLFSDQSITCKFLDVPHQPRSIRNEIAGFFPLRAEAVQACDIAWFPWFHAHRIAFEGGQRIIGSFHDGVMFTEPKFIDDYPFVAQEERETVRQWLASPTTMICSSRFWAKRLGEIFGCPDTRLHVVPLAGAHVCPSITGNADSPRFPWLSSPYFLCPANVSPHKNHEILFEGYALSTLEWPLVLTGTGSDFRDYSHQHLARRILRRAAVGLGIRKPRRGQTLRKLATSLGLKIGKSLVPLGYLPSNEYDLVLESAAAVIMPTLGEGGGSFPVEEAVLCGVPVVCADIPILREQMARIHADVMWFDPTHPQSLADRLRECNANFSAIKAAALAQTKHLRTRCWPDVAQDYLRIFRAIAAKP